MADVTYYDRSGTAFVNPTAEQAKALWDPAARRVAEDTVDDVWASTVCIVIDHSFGVGRPIIFETMTFGPDPWVEQCWRYCTEAEALAGHAEVVRVLRSGAGPDAVELES